MGNDMGLNAVINRLKGTTPTVAQPRLKWPAYKKASKTYFGIEDGMTTIVRVDKNNQIVSIHHKLGETFVNATGNHKGRPVKFNGVSLVCPITAVVRIEGKLTPVFDGYETLIYKCFVTT